MASIHLKNGELIEVLSDDKVLKYDDHVEVVRFAGGSKVIPLENIQHIDLDRKNQMVRMNK